VVEGFEVGSAASAMALMQAARGLFERDGFRLTTIAAVAAQA
jgi:AcrR family transcriptional regulator